MERTVFKSMEEILRTAIEREADSFDFYFNAALQVGDPKLRRFLNELAEMEREHLKRLGGELDALEARRWLDRALSC